MNVETLETADRVKLRAARSIAVALMPAEQMVDQAIVAGSLLVGRIAQASLDAKAPAELMHVAIEAASAGITNLVQARSKIVDCHQYLAVARDDCNLRAEDVGCTLGKAVRRELVPNDERRAA